MAAAFSAALILQSATGAHGRLAKDQKIVSRAVSTKQLAMAQRNAMGEKKQALSGPAMAEAGGADIFIEEGFELVMGRHLVLLAAFFMHKKSHRS
jgi:hypothetical protein